MAVRVDEHVDPVREQRLVVRFKNPGTVEVERAADFCTLDIHAPPDIRVVQAQAVPDA
jgi:hypothetical protein